MFIEEHSTKGIHLSPKRTKNFYGWVTTRLPEHRYLIGMGSRSNCSESFIRSGSASDSNKIIINHFTSISMIIKCSNSEVIHRYSTECFFRSKFTRPHSQCTPNSLAAIGWYRNLVAPPGFRWHSSWTRILVNISTMRCTVLWILKNIPSPKSITNSIPGLFFLIRALVCVCLPSCRHFK